MAENRDFGVRLHMARWKAGMGLRALAREVGLSPATLSRAERKGIPTSIQAWFCLADWLQRQEKRDA